jgi:citrate synthase
MTAPDSNDKDSPTVHSGLAGVVSHRSSISSIIGATLTYRGINIDELSENASFEEVVCLLWNGSLPTKKELDEMRSVLGREFKIQPGVLKVLRDMPHDADPMRVLQIAMGTMGIYSPEGDDNSPEANRRKAPRITSQLSSATCAFHRLRSGNEPVEPSSELSFAANFFLLLNGRRPEKIEEETINKALILHADHELNASTFSARVTASTISDIHSALAAGIGTLKGPIHGGANRAVMESLQEIGTIEKLQSWFDDKRSRKEKIMGFGHAVYKEGDPRAKHLKKMSKELGVLTKQPNWYAISEKLETLVREKVGILPNVDFYSASSYYCLGLPPDLFTPIFACSRVVGWIAHLFEQYQDNALIRPRAYYTGPQEAHWVAIEDR